jgi:hypothetical protein
LQVNILGLVLVVVLGVYFLLVGLFSSSIFVLPTLLGIIALLGAVVVAFDTEPERDRH